MNIPATKFHIEDSMGMEAYCSNIYTGSSSANLSAGKKDDVKVCYGLANESETIKISFYSEMYPQNGEIAFEIPITNNDDLNTNTETGNFSKTEINTNTSYRLANCRIAQDGEWIYYTGYYSNSKDEKSGLYKIC